MTDDVDDRTGAGLLGRLDGGAHARATGADDHDLVAVEVDGDAVHNLGGVLQLFSSHDVEKSFVLRVRERMFSGALGGADRNRLGALDAGVHAEGDEHRADALACRRRG